MLGADFGGTQIKVADVIGGVIERSATVDTPADAGPDAVVDCIVRAVRELEPTPATLGLAIPGVVDASGTVVRVPNVRGMDGYPIGRELARLLGCPVAVENDATTAALGEQLHGHGRSLQNFVMLTLGTGIGAGLVLYGELYRGTRGFAPEVGHMRIAHGESAPICGCGKRGCVEAYAGTRGLLRRFRELGGVAAEIREVADAARRGEHAGLEAFWQMGHALGIALTSVQNALDLEAVIFTGGISRSFDLISNTIRATLREEAFAPVLAEVPLLVSELGASAGLVGAAALPTTRHIPLVHPPAGG